MTTPHNLSLASESLVAQLETKGASAPSCRLESIDRPLFSSGQLLTDGDLTALVEWGRNKLQLSRYRVGWGVVCGLGLYIDPLNEAGITVGAGYAIDACGNDLVVSKNTRVSFENCIKTEKPWEELPRSDSEKQEVSFDGFSTNDVIAIDLTLKYEETSSSPRATAGRGSNRVVPREYTRTKESFSIVCSLGRTEADAARMEADRWAQNYDKCLSVLQRYNAESIHAQPRDLHRWLSHWVTKNPPTQFRFITDWIGGHQPESWTEKEAVRVLFWLVQDARNTFLQSGCHSDAEGSGVPIGRVWLRRVQGDGAKRTWRTVALDAYPPHKRALQSSFWPAAVGEVNLGQAIWLTTGDAASTIGRLGIRVNGADELFLPDEARSLEEKLATPVQVAWDARVRLRIFNTGVLGYRTVGIG